LSIAIKVLSQEETPHELTETNITLLPYQQAQIINSSTATTPAISIYNNDGSGAGTGVDSIVNAINLKTIAKSCL
jgi:hypothetical protein